MGFLVILLVIAAGFAAWRFRVPLMAKVLGQDEARVRRQLQQRRKR